MTQSLHHVAEIETSGSGLTTTYQMTFSAKLFLKDMKMMLNVLFGFPMTFLLQPVMIIPYDFGLNKMVNLSLFRFLKGIARLYGV